MTEKKIWNPWKFPAWTCGRRWIALSAMVVGMAAGLPGQTAADLTTAPHSNRITQEVSSGAMVAIAGSVHPLARRANDLGPVNPEMRMESLSLNIGVSATQQKEIEALLEAQQNPKSPQYHRWLTQEEYGALFGLTQGDLNQITRWLSSQGFAVKSIAPSRNLITFSGTVAQVEIAFRTQLHSLELNGETHMANTTEVQIPAAMAGVVTHVGGLHNFRAKPHVKKPNPQFTSSVSGYHSLTPGDWATIYNVAAIYSAGYTGTGMHVGVVGATYFPKSDIDNFRAAAGLSATKLNMVCMNTAYACTGTASESINDIVEADLDVEWAGGIAKDATVDFLYASYADPNDGPYDALVYGITTYKVNGALVPVFSMSYGNCESDMLGYTAYYDYYFQQAATQGQTILNASGDAGAAGCDAGYSYSVYGAVADWPASSPYVTGVGGTTFNNDGSVTNPDLGADAYWNYNSSADIVSSAIQYIPETGWNDTAVDQAVNSSNPLSSSGGGVSQIYALPSWQWRPGNFSGTSMRFEPDVAFSASADHDPYLVCTQLFSSTATSPSQTLGSTCVNGFRYSDGSLGYSYIGGTSAGSPSFAGMLTLLVQKYGKFVNLNQTLYNLAKVPATYATVFRDVVSGNNAQPCVSATPGCSGGLVGYAATTGYDLVTGLGSINGGALLTALGGPSTATTATTLTALPGTVEMGGTTSLVATVTSSAAGTITGSVTFKVGSATLGTVPVTSGVALLNSLIVSAAAGFTVGNDPLTATYSGDTNYAASSAGATLSVTPAPAASTVTASGGPVALGGVVNLTATVSPTPLLMPTGSVTFSTGVATLGTAPLVSGVATLNNVAATLANGLGKGVNTVQAAYSGDGNFLAASSSFGLVVYDPAIPLVLALSPASATTGGANFTLTVNGANFASNSVVLWSGQPRATTHVSSTQLTATISAADIASEAIPPVTVANLSPAAGTSAAAPFQVVSSTPVAILKGATIATAGDASGNHLLSLTGTDFVSTSAVLWNGGSRSTSYLGPVNVSATISSTDYSTRPATVTVTNPSGTSPAFTIR